MPIMVQVVLDDVSKFGDLLTINGQHVVQTRTSNQQVVADITAKTGSIPTAGTNVCWRSSNNTVALFLAVVDVLLVKIQHRKRKSTLWYLLLFWLSPLCSYQIQHRKMRRRAVTNNFPYNLLIHISSLYLLLVFYYE